MQEAGIVYVEKTPNFIEDSSYKTETRRELLREERKRCCRLPNGLTMHDLYSMPQEDFDKLEESVPGAKYMHPYCLAEIFGRHGCRQNNPEAFRDENDDNENDDADKNLIVLDAFIGGVAKMKNKILRGIEDNSKVCTVTNMPMDKVRKQNVDCTRQRSCLRLILAML